MVGFVGMGAEQRDMAAPRLPSSLRSPANLLLLGTAALGLASLLTWSGIGPKSWEARICAEMADQGVACPAASRAKFTERVPVSGGATR